MSDQARPIHSKPFGQAWPAYQNMISMDDSATVINRHAYNLRLFNATEQDCWIERMEQISNDPHHFLTRFQLHCSTYLGWKVYMLHTGCFAIIPDLEKQEPQR
jgi:hypothetical protein